MKPLLARTPPQQLHASKERAINVFRALSSTGHTSGQVQGTQGVPWGKSSKVQLCQATPPFTTAGRSTFKLASCALMWDWAHPAAPKVSRFLAEVIYCWAHWVSELALEDTYNVECFFCVFFSVEILVSFLSSSVVSNLDSAVNLQAKQPF